MDFDEYETLPTNNFLIHMIAGAIAGVMEHCVMYPLDSVKTRMQSLSPNVNYTGISDALKVVVRQEGIFRLVRGMNAVVAGAGPAHALYFSCYEQLKEILQARTAKPFYMVAGVSGGVATILHDAVMTPTEVVKQRLQMYNSPYKSIVDCARRTYHAEGMRAFYRSYTTQLTMNIPFQSIHFMTYEFCQSLMNEKKSYNPGVHMASGAVAGAVAAAITTPLDVVKTLLNTQQHSVKGMRAAFKTVYRISGFAGYFKGIQARIIYQMPSTAICWSVYELFKYLLSSKVKEVRCSDKPLTPKILMSDDDISPKLCPGLLFVESSVEREDGYPNEIETKNNWEDKIEVEEESAGERSPIEVIGRTFADENKWSNNVSTGMQIFDTTLLAEQCQ